MSDERLDEETEKLLRYLLQAGFAHGPSEKRLSLAECEMCQKQVDALRQRIRTLVEEARRSTREATIGYD